MSVTRYGFLVSADEIMFLRFEIIEKVHYPDNPDEHPDDLYSEPWLHYSAPSKLADVLDDDNGNTPAKIALLYMLLDVSEEDSIITQDLGNSEKYRGKTKVGQKWAPKFSFVGPDGKLDPKRE